MKKIIVVVSCLFLAACLEETKTVDYYLAHEEEMNAKLQECRNNPGEKDFTPNCVNARDAANRTVLSSKNSGMPQIK